MTIYHCYNIDDRTKKPKICNAPTEQGARNWCKFTSMDFYGIFTFSESDIDPTEFWRNGRKYKTARSADLARVS